MELGELLRTLQRELKNHSGYQITHINDVGTDIMINCPYHGGGRERNPSYGIIKQDKQTSTGHLPAGFGHCFACGAVASFDKLVYDTLNFDTPELAKRWAVSIGYKESLEGSKSTSLAYIEPIEEVPMKVEYKKYITYHPYMRERGIGKETAEEFKLGYDPEDNSMTIPVLDRYGVCRMVIRRAIDPNAFLKFKNTSGADKETLLYGRYHIFNNKAKLQADTLYIVESSIDAMLMWQSGAPAVATMQASPTKSQIEQIKRMPHQNIVIATDNDTAGNNGALKYLDQFPDKNLYRLIFPEGTKDIGDFTPEQRRRIRVRKMEPWKETKRPHDIPLVPTFSNGERL